MDIIEIAATFPLALILLPFILMAKNDETRKRLAVIQVVALAIQLLALSIGLSR